jgi:hypothetical protein
MNRLPPGSDAGVCLIEVMIALAAGAVVLAATLQSLGHFERRLSTQHVAAAQAQDLRIGLKVLEDDLRAIGTGPVSPDAPLSVAGRQEIEFAANLGGLVTTLTAPVSSIQQELSVADGAGWPKGKQVLVCDREHCAGGRLARDGQKARLSIMTPLGREFEAGSEVRVVNRVRYYVKMEPNGPARLMRDVDGGVNPLIGDIARFQFSYHNRDGARTTDPSRAVRVRVEAAVGKEHPLLTQDIGLRLP